MPRGRRYTLRLPAARITYYVTMLFKVHMIIATALILTACGSGDQPDDQSDVDANKTQIASTDSLVIDLVGVDSLTVLDLLKAEHQVDYRSTISGVFVTMIDSTESGSNYFWIYSVNDTMPPLACDQLVTLEGDRVRWYFRRFGE